MHFSVVPYGTRCQSWSNAPDGWRSEEWRRCCGPKPQATVAPEKSRHGRSSLGLLFFAANLVFSYSRCEAAALGAALCKTTAEHRRILQKASARRSKTVLWTIIE
jgi:hypothetical protein